MMLFTSQKLLNDEESKKAEYLYERYKPVLISVAMKILKDQDAVEDAVQDAFHGILRHLDAIEDCDSRRTANYLIVAIKHSAYKKYKKLKSDRNNLVDIEEYSDSDMAAESQDVVWDEVKLHIKRHELKVALEKLDVTNRFLLIGKYYYGLSYKQLAAIVQISENAVSTRITRAKNKVAKILKEMEVGE